jgi:hypothetical protein
VQTRNDVASAACVGTERKTEGAGGESAPAPLDTPEFLREVQPSPPGPKCMSSNGSSGGSLWTWPNATEPSVKTRFDLGFACVGTVRRPEGAWSEGAPAPPLDP